jgi:hypothetical protein
VAFELKGRVIVRPMSKLCALARCEVLLPVLVGMQLSLDMKSC